MSQVKAPVCPDHSTAAVLVSSPAAALGVEWVCNVSGCDYRIGIKDGPWPFPNGTMANAELRKLRGRLHQIYTARIHQTPKRKISDRAVLVSEQRRINFMNETDCRRLLMELVSQSTESAREAVGV